MLTLFGGMQVKLKPHQQIPIKFMKNNHGLVLFHSTGSGKTITSLFAMYQFNKDIIIIGPKSSRKSFTDNIIKAGLDPKRVTFYTFAKIKDVLVEEKNNINMFRNKSVIVDEAHNIRNETLLNVELINALKLSYKIVLLSATPVINYFNDIAVLVNIIKNNTDLPTKRDPFNRMFYDDDDYKILNKDILENKMKNCISYYKQKDDASYPESKTEYIDVVMNEDQMKQYVYYIQKLLLEDKQLSESFSEIGIDTKIDFRTLSKKKKNFFLSATRQISNCVDGESSPKILAIYNKIKKGPFPVIVYSNFKKNGIYALAKILDKNNVSYGSITGESLDQDINETVNNYNNNKYKVLLITAAGSESLDLKNTRQIHIMEPFWNEGRVSQVIGRAIRYKSHANLPKKERNVIIYRWVSTFPKEIDNMSADEYLVTLNERKERVFNKFIDLIKKVSIERNEKILSGGENDIYYNEYIKYKTRYLQCKVN